MRFPGSNIIMYLLDMLSHGFLTPTEDFGVQSHTCAFNSAEKILNRWSAPPPTDRPLHCVIRRTRSSSSPTFFSFFPFAHGPKGHFVAA